MGARWLHLRWMFVVQEGTLTGVMSFFGSQLKERQKASSDKSAVEYQGRLDRPLTGSSRTAVLTIYLWLLHTGAVDEVYA